MLDQPETPNPLGGLRKFSIKFQGQKAAGTDPTTGQPTPASGPDHGVAEISLESHPPAKPGAGGGMTKESAPTPQQFGGGTQLDPLSQALLPHWLRANGVDPDSIDGHTYDYAGAYKQTGGKVMGPGVLQGAADKINTLHAGRHPMIQSMLDSMKPVASHGGVISTPGSPSMGDALQGKIQDASQYPGGGGDALQILRRTLASQGAISGSYNGGGIQ